MKILIIEDEKLLADSIQTLLQQKGFEVETAYDGETGEAYAQLGIYDLLILDVMMPKMNGYEVARKVRSRKCGTPILMLTARTTLEDRITGLNAGADYYLTKPFDTRELLACINALLRRQGTQINEVVYGNTSLDLASGMLVCGDNSIRLSAKEFDIMRFLSNPGAATSPKKSFSPACGDMTQTQWRTMWRSMLVFCAKNYPVLAPMSALKQSAEWDTTWRQTAYDQKTSI